MPPFRRRAWQSIMADYKKIKRKENPEEKSIRKEGNVDAFYKNHPAWSFAGCDRKHWSIYAPEIRKIFLDEILPYMQALETRTWSEILVDAKKQNHSIQADRLNKVAIDRLTELCVEADSLISLRVSGTHRIYGYMDGQTYHLIWIDLQHGDNTHCVCRSRKKEKHFKKF